MPDVLVLDAELNWGGADGVLAHLREDELIINAVPVVLLTAERRLEGRESELLAAPVVCRLLKPFRLSALLEAVTFAIEYHGHAPAR